MLAGATLVPRPFRPVLRGLLLTGGRPRTCATISRRRATATGRAERRSGGRLRRSSAGGSARSSPRSRARATVAAPRCRRKTVSRLRSRSGGSRSIRSRWGSGSEENVGGGRRDYGRGGRVHNGARGASLRARRGVGAGSAAARRPRVVVPPLTATGLAMIPTYGMLETELSQDAATWLDADVELVGGNRAGVEIERRVIRGRRGRHAGGSWPPTRTSWWSAPGVEARWRARFSGRCRRRPSHHASRPVAVVAAGARPGDQSRIVVGSDGSPGSAAALEWAFAEARLRGISIHAVSGRHEPWGLAGGVVRNLEAVFELREALARSAEDLLDEAERATPHDVPFPREAIAAPAGPALVAAAADSDLLVVARPAGAASRASYWAPSASIALHMRAA